MLGQKLRNKANTQQQSKSVDFFQNLPCHISYRFLIIKIKILILRLYLPYCVSLCSTLSFFGFPDIVHVSAICIVPIARIVSEEGHFLWRMYYLEGATLRIIKCIHDLWQTFSVLFWRKKSSFCIDVCAKILFCFEGYFHFGRVVFLHYCSPWLQLQLIHTVYISFFKYLFFLTTWDRVLLKQIYS